jgi:hypothetical protein
VGRLVVHELDLDVALAQLLLCMLEPGAVDAGLTRAHHRRERSPLWVTAFQPEHLAVPLDRALDVLDRNRDVVDVRDVHVRTIGLLG